jgi:OmcA/MtrC family decaheme c-type cytochrome
MTQGGRINSAITGVTFTPAGDNVLTAVTFTFEAFNQAGLDITSNIDLRTQGFSGAGVPQLTYTRFSIAQLVPGQNGDPHEWFDFANNQRTPGRLVLNGDGSYTYTFTDNSVTVTGGYQDNLTTRAAIQISGLTTALFTSDPLLAAPVANPTFDLVPNGSAITVTRDVVTTAACNACHDPLSAHGSRREVKFCVVCHNSTLPPDGQLVRLVHKIHSADNNIVIGTQVFTQFGEVTYPQDRRNCTTCHKGPDGNNWRTRPSIEACGTCHIDVNFATGAGHLGGPQANNVLCAVCHFPGNITIKHTTENSTPNNLADPPGLATFQYGIDNVTVDNTNRAVVQFWIKSAVASDNGSLGPFGFVNLGASGDNAARPSGFSGSPSFLVAYALPQGGITAPADYNNLGKTAGQPASVTLIGQRLTGTPTQYTVTLPSSAAFPAGATMRAVALQAYFTQTNVDVTGDGVPDNVGRHTPAVVKGVTGDAVRRSVVKSGYNATTGAPEGCLECHEVFEGHGGNRVNNVQVCVMCHNPNLTSSGRTIDPAGADPINPTIVADFGSDPLLYPEVPNNFKELIHGLHSTIRPDNPFVDIRNRTTSGFAGVEIRTSEITFPGNPRHCTKCHIGTTATNATYKAAIPANVLFSTYRTTTGNTAETRAEILAARNTVPNQTDQVSSPTASTCYACHASDVLADHARINGGDISVSRSTASVTAVPAALSIAAPAP